MLEREPIVQLSAGYAHTAIVTSSGKLYTCGDDSYGQLGQLPPTDEELAQFGQLLSPVHLDDEEPSLSAASKATEPDGIVQNANLDATASAEGPIVPAARSRSGARAAHARAAAGSSSCR